MKAEVYTNTNSTLMSPTEVSQPKSPNSQSIISKNDSYSKEELIMDRIQRIKDPEGIFNFYEDEISPIKKIYTRGPLEYSSGFFQNSPLVEVLNDSSGNFVKKVKSSKVEVIHTPVQSRSFRSYYDNKQLNESLKVFESRDRSPKSLNVATPSTNEKTRDEHSHLHADQLRDHCTRPENSFQTIKLDDFTKVDDKNSNENIKLRESDPSPMFGERPFDIINSNTISDYEFILDARSVIYSDSFNKGAQRQSLEPKVVQKNGISLDITPIYAKSRRENLEELKIAIQPRVRVTSKAKQVYKAHLLRTTVLETIKDRSYDDSFTEKNNNNDSQQVHDRSGPIELRLNNNNTDLKMDSQKSAHLSHQSTKRRLNILRSSTLKRSCFDNHNFREPLARNDSCEPANSYNLSHEEEDVYYGDNKFVNPKNTISNRYHKLNNMHNDMPKPNENEGFLNLPDPKRLNVCKSKVNLFPSTQLSQMSLNLMKPSNEDSIKSPNDRLGPNEDHNLCKNDLVHTKLKNLLNDPYQYECDNTSNLEVNKSKENLMDQQIFKDKFTLRNFSSKDSLFGSNSQLFKIAHQRRFTTGSQAVINFNKSDVNNIDVGDDKDDNMSRKSSPVKMQAKKTPTSSKKFFNLGKKSHKKFIDDVQSSATRSEKPSIFYENYEIQDNLGSGHFGTVYKCKNKFDGLIYAIKVINTGAKTAINEAQALASLNVMYESTHIVRYFSSWKEDQKVYIVMEMCSKNLEQWNQVNPKIDEKMIRRVIKHLCKALSKLHKDKVVHLDIKPENILISNSGKFKISDLGLAKMLKNKDDVRTLVEGDARYMAKELLNDFSFEDINNEKVDLTKADIFSLGITIYELMTRNILTLPKNGQIWHQLRDNNIPYIDKLPGYSNSLKRLVTAMMDTDASKRPSAKEILNNHLLYNQHNKIMLLKEQIKLLKQEVFKESRLLEKSKSNGNI